MALGKPQLLAMARRRLLAPSESKRRADIFRAVAAHLGRPYPSTKRLGYVMLAEFCGEAPIIHHKARTTKQARKDANVASDEFLESYEWRKLRMVVIQKRGRRCECCGATPADGKTIINVDHIKPRKLHPELALEESNLQVLCHVCNHGKGNWDQTDWREATA